MHNNTIPLRQQSRGDAVPVRRRLVDDPTSLLSPSTILLSSQKRRIFSLLIVMTSSLQYYCVYLSYRRRLVYYGNKVRYKMLRCSISSAVSLIRSTVESFTVRVIQKSRIRIRYNVTIEDYVLKGRRKMPMKFFFVCELKFYFVV